MKQLRHGIILVLLTLLVACTTPASQSSAPAASTARLPNAPIKKITLMLPTTGPTAAQSKAIQSGFFSAYYRDRSSNPAAPSINVVDTQGHDINQLYDNALASGADLVVGPLLKGDVDTLKKRTQLRVFALALNETNTNALNKQVLEYSLSPQDEAAQVAKKAFNDGKRQALIIAPAGAWGEGIADAFSKQWRALGGTVVDQTKLAATTDISTAMRHLLHATAKTDNNQESGRRQDFDMVFLAATPMQARQIKPLLSYYGADNITVYGSSLVYSGTQKPALDKDLDNLIFCDMPWIFAPPTTENRGAFARLYAFGEDAYLLATHLPALNNGSLNGVTGQLSLNANLHINRAVSFGVFRQGVPQTR